LLGQDTTGITAALDYTTTIHFMAVLGVFCITDLKVDFGNGMREFAAYDGLT